MNLRCLLFLLTIFHAVQSEQTRKKMYAYVYHKEDGKLRLNEVDMPHMPVHDYPEGCLINVLNVTICETDIVNHQHSSQLAGYAPGHEVLGRVVSCGPESPLKPGQLIVYYGATDFGGLAEYKWIAQPIFPTTDTSDIALQFIEERQFYDTVGAAVCVLIEPICGANLLEPLTGVMRALWHHTPKPNEVVVIYGEGFRAHMALQLMLKIFGVSDVYVLGTVQDRLDRIKTAGASDVFNLYSKKDKHRLNQMIEKNNGSIADYAFEALPINSTSNEDVDVRLLLTRMLRPGGRLHLFAVSNDREFTAFWPQLLSKQIELLTTGFDFFQFPMQNTARLMEVAHQLVKSGLIDICGLVDGNVDFMDEEAVLDVMFSYGRTKNIKTIIQVSK